MMELPINRIICGDALKELVKLPSESVDMIMTSPPYWSLRDYSKATETVWDADENCQHEWIVNKQKAKGGHTKLDNMPTVGSSKAQQNADNAARWGYESNFCSKCGAWRGQLGMEPTPELYIKHLCDIFDECKRVLKKTGSCYVVIGDTYYGGGGFATEQSAKRQAAIDTGAYPDFASNSKFRSKMGKSLVNIPARFQIEMCSRGWILRNEIIWCIIESMKMFVKRDNEYLHIPIKNIEVGDSVFILDRNQETRTVKIINKFNSEDKEVLRITTKSGREITCSAKHEFPVKSCCYYGEYIKLHFKKAEELTTKDHLWINYSLPIPLLEGNQVDYEKGFICGFFIAEGTYIKQKVGIYKDNPLSKNAQKRWGRKEKPGISYYGVQFACGVKDRERGYLEFLEKYNIRTKNYTGNALSIYSYDKNLLDMVKTYINGEVCHEKHLKQAAWNTSLKFIKGIVDGFLAGDGHDDKGSSRWRIGIKPNEKIKDDLMLACRLIGYESRYEGIKKNNYGTHTMGITIRKKISRKIIGGLYVDKIHKIEKLGKKKTYDIEIEPIYTSFCGKGETKIPTTEKRKGKWNNLYFLANGIWTHNCKPNCMPSNVKDRYTVDFEKVFFFVKNKKYYFEMPIEKYEKPLDRWGGESLKPHGTSQWDEGTGQSAYRERNMRPNPDGRGKRCVWRIETKPSRLKHFAKYPEKLCVTPIKASCPEGGIVLDPFLGSGTTALIAGKLKRNWLGIEINPEYCVTSEDRINDLFRESDEKIQNSSWNKK